MTNTHNKKILEEYLQYNKNTLQNAYYTYHNQDSRMRCFIEKVNKNFDDVSKTDVDNFLSGMIGEESTKEQYKKTLKKFFKWLSQHQLDEEIEKERERMKKQAEPQSAIEEMEWKRRNYRPKYPMSVAHLKVKNIPCKLTENDILSPEQVYKIIDVCDNPRDKAIIAVLWDVMARGGMPVEIKLGDLTIRDNLIDVKVMADDGPRTIPFVFSAPYVFAWLNLHKWYGKEGFEDKPLFYALSRNMIGKPMQEPSVNNIVKKYAKLAGIKKRVYCHLIRHSRTTYLKRKGMSSDSLKHVGLWKKNSIIPDTVYTHLCSEDHRNELLRSEGLAPIVVDEKNPIINIICTRCHEHNPCDADYCFKCHQPLSEFARMEEEQSRKQIMREEISKTMDKRISDLEATLAFIRGYHEQTVTKKDGSTYKLRVNVPGMISQEQADERDAQLLP